MFVYVFVFNPAAGIGSPRRGRLPWRKGNSATRTRLEQQRHLRHLRERPTAIDFRPAVSNRRLNINGFSQTCWMIAKGEVVDKETGS